MAPSLPGTSGRRSAAKGSSSSTSTIKREARSARAASKQDSDSDDQSRASPSGSRRPTRKTSSRSKARSATQEIEDEDKDESDEDGEGTVEEGLEESSVPPEDLEEIEGEIDEAGETKVTKNGELLGGRQYRCRTFKLPTRGDRIYMLSMEPARILGFRDSYLFFMKNQHLVRVNTTVEERQWMIENGLLMANFKSKLIAVVTARSIFKFFGARIVKNGRGRVDDYFESNATEDDLVDESEGDVASRAGDDHASGANGSSHHGDGVSASHKRKLLHNESMRQITDLNWQYESAMAVRALNSRLKELRKENPKFMDPHTNIEQVPSLSQPTRCEVQAAPDVFSSESAKAFTGSGDNATGHTSTVLSIPRSIGPIVDATVKIEIRAGVPPPPMIHDPGVWAAIPEEIRQELEEAEFARPMMEEGEILTRYPISIISGQYQAAYPIHQARFQQPYRIILPQSMGQHAQYIHHLWSTQSRYEGPLLERATLLGSQSINSHAPIQHPMQHPTQPLPSQANHQQQHPQLQQQWPQHPQQPVQFQPQMQQAASSQYSRRR